MSDGDTGGVGGVRGTLCGGIIDPELGVAGVCATDELGDVATGPGGRGSEVASLADPGRTRGLESAILGFLASAYPLYTVNIVSD